MFNSDKKKVAVAQQEAMNSNNIIGKGSTFKGEIQTYGNIRIEGKVIGDIISKSKIAIGPSAVVEGNVKAQIAEVEGTVTGSLEISDVLTLKGNCTVNGDIISNKLVVESGAKFDGQCKMGNQNMKIELPDLKEDKVKDFKKAM